MRIIKIIRGKLESVDPKEGNAFKDWNKQPEPETDSKGLFSKDYVPVKELVEELALKRLGV